MSLPTTSTALGTMARPSNPINSPVDSFDNSSLPKGLGDHLRIGSVAFLIQDQGPNAGIQVEIRCARPDHCGSSLLASEPAETLVVVLAKSRRNRSGKTDNFLVALITSHNDHPLEKLAETLDDASQQQHLIPIEHPDSQNSINVLRLSRGTLENQSYVAADHIYKVPSSMLRASTLLPEKCPNPRLQESSYQFLMQNLGIKPQKYGPTPTTQLESFPYPGPDLPSPVRTLPRPLRYEYATIRHGYNHEDTPKQDIHEYMIIHTGVIHLEKLLAARPTTRQVSKLISFPALPPTPSQSPDRSRKTTRRDRGGENQPLLPAPVTDSATARSRAENGVRRQKMWLGIVTIVLVLGWLLFLHMFQGTLGFGD